MARRQYAEERHARALHRRLGDELSRWAAAAVVDVAGDGVHWHCSAVQSGRSCRVACFDLNGVAEYLATFSDGGAAAVGRTRVAEDVAGAVVGWLSGQELAALHARFAFIDGNLRALRRVEAEVIARCPELQSGTARELRPLLGDSHELWFRAGDRSCRVSYYGDNDRPDAAFHWDDCDLFAVERADAGRLAALLSRWLCDRAMPSALTKEFPWLDVGPVARHYEEGRGVEGEFLASWGSIVQFYEEMDQPFTADALAFIARLRESGFDHTLRAGQSLFTLMLSRSRRHGLREGQAWIAFDFHSGAVAVSAWFDGDRETLTVAGTDPPPELLALLERLEEKPID